MSMQVSDILRIALQKGGAIRKNESPDAGELQDALTALTVMLHSWAARRLMVRATVQESVATVDGTGAYTVGVGGALNTAKPIKIVSAFLVDSNNLKTLVSVVDKDVFDSYGDSLISEGRPISLYYDPGAAQQATQTGTMNLYPIPDAVYTLYINSTKPFVDFTDIADTVTFEPPYEEAIIYSLAVRLWPEYHKPEVQVPASIYEIMKESMEIVETMNTRQVVSETDLPGSRGGGYNVYTGGYA